MDRLDWLLRWFSALLTGIVFTMTLDTDTLAPAAFLIINQALFVTIICYLLLPVPNSSAGLFINGAAGVPLLIILSQLSTVEIVPLQVLFHISIVVLCLSFFLWSLSQLSTTVLAGSYPMRKPIMLFTVCIISSPVWLGPIIDIYQPGDSITNGIISVTPLTHMSVAADYDYLRSEWFYQNTPFGSLPFSYPSLLSITAGYLLLVITLQIIDWWLTRHVTDLAQAKKNSFNISRWRTHT